LPYYPQADDTGIPYNLTTKGEKLVIDYLRLSIMEVQDMDLDIYLYFQREAYIHALSQTKEGRDYLMDCWRITQTKTDRKSARKLFLVKKGVGDGA